LPATGNDSQLLSLAANTPKTLHQMNKVDSTTRLTIEMQHRHQSRRHGDKCHGGSHHSFLVVFAGLLSAVIALSMLWSCAMFAASDCITEPKFQTRQGSHWYYHLDPVNDRMSGRLGVKVARGHVDGGPLPELPSDYDLRRVRRSILGA
jgi:hypothetical protein